MVNETSYQDEIIIVEDEAEIDLINNITANEIIIKTSDLISEETQYEISRSTSASQQNEMFESACFMEDINEMLNVSCLRILVIFV